MLTITYQNIDNIFTTEPFLPYLPNVFKTTVVMRTGLPPVFYSDDFEFSRYLPTLLKSDILWFTKLLIDGVEYLKCEDLGEVISTPYGYYLEDYDYTEGRVLYVNTGGRWLGGSVEQSNGVDIYQLIKFVRELRFSFAHTQYIGEDEYLPRIKSVGNFGFEADHLFNSVLKEQSFSFVLDNADGFLDDVFYKDWGRLNSEIVVSEGEDADNQYSENFIIESYEVGLNEIRVKCKDSRWRINDTVRLETFGELFKKYYYADIIENKAILDVKIPISFGTMEPMGFVISPDSVWLPAPDQHYSLTGYCLGYSDRYSGVYNICYFVGRELDTSKVIYTDEGGDVLGEILLGEETQHETTTRERRKVYRKYPSGGQAIDNCWIDKFWGLPVIVCPVRLEDIPDGWAIEDVNPVQCYRFTTLMDGVGGDGLNAKDVLDKLLNYGEQRVTIDFVNFKEIEDEKYSIIIEDDYRIVDLIGNFQQYFYLSYFFRVHKSAITAYPNYGASWEASSVPELAVRDIDYYDIVKVSDTEIKNREYNSVRATIPSYGMYEASRLTSRYDPTLELSKLPVNKSTYAATIDYLNVIAVYELGRISDGTRRLSLTLSRLDYSLNIYGYVRVDLSKKILDSTVREFAGVRIVKILKIEYDIEREETTISGYIDS